jgi:multicomponent Na+:H+ antiporter subunit C
LVLEGDLIRRGFGIVMLGSTINLLILICGRLNEAKPGFIPEKIHLMGNPLPQALILTAIVIGFGLLSFLCVLLKKVIDNKKGGQYE